MREDGLYINSTQSEDSGVYTCYATNEYGMVIHGAFLKVKSVGKLESWLYMLTQGVPTKALTDCAQRLKAIFAVLNNLVVRATVSNFCLGDIEHAQVCLSS